MLFNYQEFLDGIDRAAYHEGEWQWEEDGYTVTRTYTYSAPGCHDSCGVLMYVKDGKLEKIEGDPLDPCANGRLCMRCLNLVEGVNYEERPKYPLRRAGERGENKWERITWDEALDQICDWIHTNLDEAGFGRESIFVNHGTGRNISSWVPFLGGACLGTPNIGAIGFSGYSCYLPRTCGTAAGIGDFPIVDASEGHEDRYANPDWKNPDVVVIWGSEPLKSNADGYLGHWLNVCHQMGTEIISVDPQLTWWGARAAYWLNLRPGTDLALALAWLNVITTEDLQDKEFIDLWCAYYDDLKAHVAQYTPEWAAEITGVDAEDIAAAARLYANAERGAIHWGLAFDTQVDSIQLCQTVSNLMSVCGNIDKPGTNLLVRNGFEINPGYATAQLYCDPDTFAKKLTVDLVHPGCVQFIGMADCDAVNRAFETGEPYPIKMAWIQGSNSIVCSSTAAPRVYKMLSSVEFCVVADPYMTPSAVAFADIFLPLKTTAERDSMRVWWTPLRAMKSVSEWYEAKSDEELIVALGLKLNPELFEKRWPTVEALLQDYLDVGFNLYDPETGKSYKSAGRSKAGMIEVEDVHTDFWKKHHADGECSFDALVQKGGYEYDDFCATYYKYEKGLLRPDGQPGFSTPSGRIEAGALRHVRRLGHSSFGRARHRAFHQAPPDRRGIPQGVPVHLHQRLALLRVLPLREPPAGHHARVPSVAARQDQPADGRGIRHQRGRMDLDREHRGPLQAGGAHRPGHRPALHSCRARLVVSRTGTGVPAPLWRVRLQHQQPDDFVRDRFRRHRQSAQGARLQDLQGHGRECGASARRSGHRKGRLPQRLRGRTAVRMDDRQHDARRGTILVKGILVNYEYCTGCHSCEVACKKHLGLPAGEFGIKVAEIGPFEYEGAKNNKDRWEWTWMPVLTKACDMCEDRVAKGKMPMCVQHCQAWCLYHGEVGDLAKKIDGTSRCALLVPSA